MNSTPLIFLGILLGLACSWWGMVVAPKLQFGTAQMVSTPTAGYYPVRRPGLAQQGADIYRAQGCNHCHSQVVRPREYGTDLAQGWGERRTVAQDYLGDDPVLLGSVRVGPDLANMGRRMGAGDTNVQPAMVAYHLKHLYHPRTVMPGSVMPAYRYLFEKRRIAGAPSANALKLEGPFAPEPGYEIVPRREAQLLVAYLLSLRADISLPEAPILPPSTNAASADTNQVSATTTTNTPAAPPPVP
jgi:cytochrome c oxidase cbb3-type subunit 2